MRSGTLERILGLKSEEPWNQHLNALIAGLGGYEFSELMSWPISVAGLQDEAS